MLFEVAKWATACLSLAGVALNIRHNRACFHVWACTNAAWAGIDLWHGIYAQAALHTIYLGMAVWGLVAWKKEATRGEA